MASDKVWDSGLGPLGELFWPEALSDLCEVSGDSRGPPGVR